jgi:hypothetical protein
MINGHTAQASRPCWKNHRHRDLIEHFGSGESSAAESPCVSVWASTSSIAASMTPQRLPVH